MSENSFLPKQRLSLTMDSDIVAKVDLYAKKTGISRSGAISVLVTQALNATNALDSINELNSMIKDVQEQERKKQAKK